MAPCSKANLGNDSEYSPSGDANKSMWEKEGQTTMGGRLIKYRPVCGLKYVVPLFVMPRIIHGNDLGFSPGALRIDERPVASLAPFLSASIYLLFSPSWIAAIADAAVRRYIFQHESRAEIGTESRCRATSLPETQSARPKVHANILRPAFTSVSSPLYSLELPSSSRSFWELL